MKRIIAILIAVALFAALTAAAAWLLMPVRFNYGATWEHYLAEPKNSVDTLFLGSSLVYCDVMPTVMAEETGTSAYVMAGPEQTIPITYFYLREACRTQSPETVVLELTGMFYKEFQSFTKANIIYMPWSLNRLRATFEAAEKSEWLNLLFPLYQCHDQLYSLKWNKVTEHFKVGPDPRRGYTYIEMARPQENITERDFTAESDTYRENLKYLKKIASYCEKKGMELVLYVAPSYERIPEAALSQLEKDIKAVPHRAYFDCNDGTWPETDSQTDWYDSLHYNIYGAEIFSAEFARRLKEIA